MSDHDDEPREDFGASRDEEVPEGVDPETGEISEQTPAEAANAEGSADFAKEIDKARKLNRKRLENVFGVPLEGHGCQTCGALGYTPELQDAEPELVHPDHLVTCDACNGYGEVITGSKADGRLTTICIACSGNGYITKTAPPATVTPIVRDELTYQGNPQTPVMGWQQPDGTFVPLGTPQAGNG